MTIYEVYVNDEPKLYLADSVKAIIDNLENLFVVSITPITQQPIITIENLETHKEYFVYEAHKNSCDPIIWVVSNNVKEAYDSVMFSECEFYNKIEYVKSNEELDKEIEDMRIG